MAAPARALALLTLAGLLALPPGARAEDDELAPSGGVAQRTIYRNGFMQLGPFVTLDAQCRLIGQARAHIVVAPTNGRLAVLRKRGEVAFAPEHPLARCNDRPVRGTTLFYSPRRGFVGPDTFTYELRFLDGERRRITYWLKVVGP